MGESDSSGCPLMATGTQPLPVHGFADEMRKEHMKGSYPQRPGEPDCAFYMRSGLCKFGVACKFNHPPDRNFVIAMARLKGEYPERIGQPECQFYLKTGTCTFGATCKFHHPKDANFAAKVQFNMLGYPLRPNEIVCAYYLKTGQCKFGNTCKFHHPQPANLLLSVHGSPVHPSVQSPTPSQLLSNWSLTRGTFHTSPRWQGNSSRDQPIFSQGSGQYTGWNASSGRLLSFLTFESPDEMQHPGKLQQRKSPARGQGLFSMSNSTFVSTDGCSLQKDSLFPERPGEPECQFYMKTGDCKFGSVCRFHHPQERSITIPDCLLSPLGLPLRPGEPLCVFYSRYGICKYGPSCKFDHPIENSVNGVLTTSATDASLDGKPLGDAAANSLTSRQSPQSHQLGELGDMGE